MAFGGDKFKPTTQPVAFWPSASFGSTATQTAVERDILNSVIAYWKGIFGEGVTVGMAFKDERIRTKDNRTYPEVLISQLPTVIDSSRQHSVLSSVIETDPESGKCKLVSSPVPVILNFQMDIYSPKWNDQRLLNAAIQYVLGCRMKPRLETAEQRRFYIEMAPGGLENEIEYIDKLKLRRSSNRFAVQAWLTNREVQELYIVLSREFEMQSEIMQDVEE